jgi:tryptophan 2,3-dioxygenase
MTIYDEQLDRIEQQLQELWADCIAAAAARLERALDQDADLEALTLLDRIVLTTRSVREQTRTLLRLAPRRQQAVDLGSLGYGQLVAAAAGAWCAMKHLLKRRGVSLYEIYARPASHPDLFQLLERSIDWDSALQGWFVEHGLARDPRMPLFPELWQVRGRVIQLSESAAQ